jgi:hypothetical protein
VATEIVEVPASFLRRKMAKELPQPEEGGMGTAMHVSRYADSVDQAAGQQAYSHLIVKARRMENELELIPPEFLRGRAMASETTKNVAG